MTRYATQFGFYEISSFPGCNQLAISTHAFILPQYRGTGKGQEAHEQRLAKLREMHYDYAICTVKSTNEPQLAIMRKNGWKQLDEFFNRETNNRVFIFGKLL